MNSISRTQSILNNDQHTRELFAPSFLDCSSFSAYKKLCKVTNTVSWEKCIDRVAVMGRILTSDYILRNPAVGASCLKKITREGFQESITLSATTDNNGKKAAHAVVKVAAYLWHTDPKKEQVKTLFAQLNLPLQLFGALIGKILNGQEEDVTKLLDQFNRSLPQLLAEWPESLPDPKEYTEQLTACFISLSSPELEETFLMPRDLIERISKFYEEVREELRNEYVDYWGEEENQKELEDDSRRMLRNYLTYSGKGGFCYNSFHLLHGTYDTDRNELAVRAAHLKEQIENYLKGRRQFSLLSSGIYRQFEHCIKLLTSRGTIEGFLLSNERCWRFSYQSPVPFVSLKGLDQLLSSWRISVISMRTELARQKYWEALLLQFHKKETAESSIQLPGFFNIYREDRMADVVYVNPKEAEIIVNAVRSLREKSYWIHRLLIDGGQFSDTSFERLKAVCQQPGQTVRVYSYQRNILISLFKLWNLVFQKLDRGLHVIFAGRIINNLLVVCATFLIAFGLFPITVFVAVLLIVGLLAVAGEGVLSLAALGLISAALGYKIYPHALKKVWEHTYPTVRQ